MAFMSGRPSRSTGTVPSPWVEQQTAAISRAAAGQYVQGDRLALPGGYPAFHCDQRRLDTGRAQIDGKNVPAHRATRLRPV
jgi:hypothetical protein